MTHSDSSSNPETPPALLDQAKQLLTLGNLVDQYPDVIARRITGLMYIVIGGGVSLSGLVFSTLLPLLGPAGNNVFVISLFVGIVLLITCFLSFKLIIPLTQSYPQLSKKNERANKYVLVAWVILVILIMGLTFYAFGFNQPIVFPLGLQIFLGVGNLINYAISRDEPSEAPFASGYLIFAVSILLSIIPILLFPPAGFSIIILVDIGGIYVLGLSTLVSAERLLLASLDR